MSSREDRRSGVAVIIVLGMLALMMMLGVAFSISMQTERRSAGNYSHAVGTKNIVWAGLARAIERINTEMAKDSTGSPYMYPPADFWVSRDPDAYKSVYINLGRGEAADYLPGLAADTVFNAKSQWRDFSVVYGSGKNQSTNVPGRYAYLIVNLSDFLDANFVGGTNRLGGLDAHEMQLTSLMPGPQVTALLDAREDNVRFETCQEMNGIINADYLSDFTNDDFMTYSRYPLGEIADVGGPDEKLYTNQLYIGGEIGTSDFPDEATFSAVMKEMLYADEGVYPSDDRLKYIYQALTDYLDEDCVPLNLASPCTESVPMINEVAIDVSSAIGHKAGISYRLGAAVEIETVYPFVKPSEHNFSVTGSVDIVIDVSTGGTIESNIAFAVDSDYKQGTNCYQRARKVVNLPFTANNDKDGNGPKFKVSMTVKGIGVVVVDSASDDDGKTVDSIVDTELEFKFPESGEIGPIPIKGHEPLGILPSQEAIDARFNWLPMFFRDSKSSDPKKRTMLAINSWTAQYNGRKGWDSGTEIYVSDNKKLISVGELGNLVRDNNLGKGVWQTFRLFDQTSTGVTLRRDHLFRYFTVASNRVVRGLANVNTPARKLLVPAFEKMPSLYPGSGKVMSNADITKFINMIIDRKWKKSGAPKKQHDYYNVSDLVDLDWDVIFPGKSIYQREAMLSYVYGLLGTRQNLFGVVVAASPVTTGMGEYSQKTRRVSTLGSKRAFAIVWRDPFPDENGRHNCFVRFFKWLEE